mmetsp:Transcript_77737/g.157905  ORF Transcript_77737/g.157905 Transcript_77737/m.157905 type:complete len:80 (-) Transcript_77737:196-435(-)
MVLVALCTLLPARLPCRITAHTAFYYVTIKEPEERTRTIGDRSFLLEKLRRETTVVSGGGERETPEFRGPAAVVKEFVS